MQIVSAENKARPQDQSWAAVNEPIERIMDRWARWRIYRPRDELGYGECITGKLLDGMPKIKCTHCVRGEQIISIKGKTIKIQCSSCQGTQWMVPKISGAAVNPKLIRGTAGKYPDELSSRVDRLVCQLTIVQQAVIFEEYVQLGTREIKQDHIGVGRRAYDSILSKAHAHILAGLAPLAD